MSVRTAERLPVRAYRVLRAEGIVWRYQVRVPGRYEGLVTEAVAVETLEVTHGLSAKEARDVLDAAREAAS